MLLAWMSAPGKERQASVSRRTLHYEARGPHLSRSALGRAGLHLQRIGFSVFDC